MKTNPVRRNVLIYNLFSLFGEPLFWGPIVILSIQRLGQMSLPEIYFMESAVMILSVALNIPAGALADVIGRKKTLIIGRVFLLASTIGFAFMASPIDAWIANILWAIGYSFQSGADQALIYNTLKSAKLKDKFSKIEGRAVGYRLIVIAFCCLAVGPMADIDLRLPLYISIPFMLVPLCLCFFFKEEKIQGNYSVKKQIETLRNGVVFAVKKPEVLWIILFCALVTGASKIWFFTYNPYFELVNIPLKYFGVIFFVLNIVAWASSHYAHEIEKKLSEKGCVVLMILCVGVPILLMSLFPCWPMAFLVATQNVVRGFMRPFVGQFTNRHITSEEIRATTLSVRTTLTDIIAIASLAWFGFMDKSLGLLGSLTVLGLVVLVLGQVTYWRYNRLFPEK